MTTADVRPVVSTPSAIVQGTCLAFLAGYVDVVGFIALFGLFTAHVTGNFVMLGVELVSASQGVLAKLLALPVFVVTVALTTLWVARCERRQLPAVRPLFWMQAALLTGFMACGLAAAPITVADSPLALLAGMLGVAAMGVQNAQSRLVLPDHVPTTIMTGNTTQIVIDLVHTIHGAGIPSAEQNAARTRLRKMLPAVAGFACGAVVGAFAYATVGFACLAAPVVILVVLAARNR
ncbi:YoaK family protein [Cupriavidus sp. RAF12]|uniref:YoaK family protein n=1 Tax=Cupriavidus sp. RAF12 TaxID=3233050 RepID=UPI003F9183EA